MIGGEHIVANGKYQRWLEPDGLLLLEGWARDGLTDEQIAHNMGINVKTLWTWKKNYDPICSAIKKGKAPVDIEVENALLKRALGYEYTEERIEISDKDGKKVVQTLKHVPPDVGAIVYWLKNRKREYWRNNPPEAAPPERNVQDDALTESLKEMAGDL